MDILSLHFICNEYDLSFCYQGSHHALDDVEVHIINLCSTLSPTKLITGEQI